MEVETGVGGHDVSSAADKETDAQLAQAAEPIGEIKEIAGNVGLFRADGEPVVAEVGTPIYLNDRVVTGSEGAVEFVFVDDTTFSVGANGEIAIDTLIYNPGGDGNALGVSVVKGAFVFLTGQIAPAAGEGMVIDTPAMNLGIRGTSGACEEDRPTAVWTCAVLPDPGTNHVGRIVITNPLGTQVLDTAFESTQVARNLPPTQTVVLSPEQATALFGDALQVLQEQFPDLAPNLNQRGELDFNPEDVNPAAGEDAGPDVAVDFGEAVVTPEALADVFGAEALGEVVAGLLADQFGGEFGAAGPAGALTDESGDAQGFATADANSTIEGPQQTFTPTESPPSPFTLESDANAVTEDGVGGPAAGDVLANDAGPGSLQVTQVNGETANVGVPIEGAFGTLTLNANGTYDYVLNNDDPAVQALGEGETAVDSFSYRASDGSATSAPATLAITVVGSNDTPVAVGDDGFAVAQGQSLTIAPGALVDNDSDIDGDALTVTAVSAPENGEASLNADGSITYVPDSGFVGQDSFTYTVSDGHGGTATATVSLVVTNQSPTPPVDTDDAPNSVAEASETGTLVGIDALSTDPDLGDIVTYSLSDDAGGRFQIDATTGVVTVKDGSLLDFEAATSHDITVAASDGTLTSTQSFTIGVTDIDENKAPIITSNGGEPAAAVSVAENTTAVTTVTAIDPDGQTPAFSIVGGADAELFTIDADTGALSFVGAPNFEAPIDAGTDNVYDVVVQASDGALTDTQAIAVTVANVNEAPTQPVDSNDAPNTVAEASETGTLVGIDALSTDPDFGDVVTYSLSDDAGGRFQIDATTGLVTVKNGSLLDFETATSHNIIVAASDGKLTSTQSFTIGVTDIAENNAPIITSNGGEPSAAANVAENTAAVTTVIAIDPDGQTPTFSIIGGADAELFTIDEDTGALSFVGAPNFEAPIDADTDNVYDVVVQASDGTSADAQAIAVTVTGVNEAPSQPVDADDSADSVAEGAAAGTPVGVDASSTDPDLGDVVTYSLTDDAGGRFQIDGTTGIVTVKDGSLLDFETATSHDLTVAASDGKLTSTQTFTIGVADVVENNAPIITSNGGEPSAAVNVAENTKAVTTVTAIDPDAGQTPTFSIVGGADAEFFTIDKATGALSFAGFPNFETPFDAGKDNIYDVIVQASDGALTDTQAIAVTVTDVNEAPSQPVDNDDASNSVAEGAATGTFVGITAQATDPDIDNKVTYSLTDDAGGRFQIDATTGVVTVKNGSLLDFEAADSHNIIVAASDGKLTSTETFTIGVTDVDETNQPPVASTAEASGNEDAAAIPITLSGEDPDGTVASVMPTSLPTNGVLYTDDSLTTPVEIGVAYPGSSVTFYFVPAPDFSGSPTFQYTVIDNEGAADSTPATATIIVAPQPDPPTTPIDDDDAPDSVAEGAASGTPVGITAFSTDPDLGDDVTYSLLDDAGGRFQIDADTGVVTVKDGSLLDFEADTEHDIVVQASDGTLTSTEIFSIGVADANEAPTIDDAAFSLAENTANGTAVGTAAAADPDAGDVLSYAITAGNVGGAFAIDTETGAITVANGAALDFETNPSFELTVEVTDALGAKDTATVTVNLTDVNEAPFITSNGGGEAAAVTIAENTKAVTIVTADDVDAGQTVTFSIAGGADAGLFAIDESTGALTFLSAPDFETLLDAGKDNIYDVVVEASDGTLIDTQSIAVTVGDVNEAPSQPVDSDDAPNTIAEASETGTSVGVDASSTDPDLGDVVTYSLSDDAGGRFRIDAATGLVTVNDGSLIDFETATSHSITVAASDGKLTSTETFTIGVTDIAENQPPVITSNGGGASAVLTIDENTTTVTTVTATDPDGQTPTFSIVGGADAALFAIDKNTGALSFLAAPNFEVPADAGQNHVYDVVVQASDGVLTDQQSIAVTVADVNEAPDQPIDDNDAGNSVAEGAAVGTLVGITAHATDPDIDNKVTYSLDDDAGGRFQIDATTGVVTVKNGSLLDFETAVSHSITVAASDGKLTSTETFTIGVTDVDETQVAPTLDLDANDSSGVTGTGYQTSYNEGGPAVPIVDTDVSITDPDDTDMEQVTIQVSPNPDGAFEQLSLTSAGQILAIEFGLSVSGNGTSSLTISGNGTEALYQAVLRAVVYQNLSDSPTPGEHQVLIQVSDGTSLSNVATALVTVVPDDTDSPVIDLDANDSSGAAGTGYQTAFSEGGPAVKIADVDATLTDPDDANLEQLTVSITNAQDGGFEQLSLTAAGQSLATDLGLSVGGSGTSFMVIAGTAAVADYQALLREVVYQNLSDAPTAGERQVQVQAYDGTTFSQLATALVTVVPDDTDSPVIDLDANDSSGAAGTGYQTAFSEGGPAVKIADVDATLTDPDDANLEQLTVSITNAQDGGFEQLSLTAAGQSLATDLGLSVGGSGTSFMVIAGTAAVADYQALLREVVYQNLSDAPTAGERQVQVQAYDGTTFSQLATALVTVVPDDTDSPVIDLDANDSSGAVGTGYQTAFSEGGPAVKIADADATITDPDDANLEQLTVSITNAQDGGFEQLSLTAAGQSLATDLGLSVGGSGTSFMVIAGTAAVADYQALLREVVYQNLSDAPTGGERQVQVQAYDGTTFSQLATALVTVVPDDTDSPVIDLDANDSSGAAGTGYQTAFSEGGPAVKIADVDATLTDPDDANLEQLTVSITNAQDGGFEQLSLTAAGQSLATDLGLSVGGSGTSFMVIAGTAAVADYQALLREVVYQNLSDAPTAGERQVQVQAYDGTTFSQLATALVTVVPDDTDSPVIDLDANDSSGAVGTGYQTAFSEGGPAVKIADVDATLTDPDDANLEQLTVSITNAQDGGFEQLSLTAAGQSLATDLGLSVGGSGTSFMVIAGTAAVADYQALLREVVYQNLSDAPAAGERQVQVQAYDGTSFSNLATAVIDVVATNAPPVITSNGGEAIGNATVAENSTAVTTVTATDPDAGQTLSFSLLSGGDGALFTINSTSGELTFVAAPDFEDPADSDGDNKYEVAVQVADGAGGFDTQVLVVTVTDTAEPPVVTNTGLTVAQAGINFLDPSELTADDDDTDPDQITYKLKSGPLHGAILLDGVVLAAGIGLFTQQDLLDGSVTYAQDGTAAASDSFEVEISDGTTTTTEIVNAGIATNGVVGDADVVGVPNDGPIVVGNKTAGSLGLAGADGDVESSGAVIAAQAGSRGIVTMFGTGATWSVGSDGLVVGGLGKGELVIQNGAKLTITADGFNNLDIGRDGGIGLVTVTGAGSELRTVGSDNTILLGHAEESTGELIVKDGGSVSTLFLGIGVEGTGKVTVTGDGSVLTASNDDGRFLGDSDPFAGQVWVGWEAGGVGTLDVLDGGLVEIRPGESANTDTREPGLSVGRELDSKGTVVVDGLGSLIHIFGQTTPPDPDAEIWGPYAQVGRDGQGTMTVTNQGQVLLEGPGSGFTVGRGNADEVAGPPPVIPQSLLTIEDGGDVIIDGKGGSADLGIGQQANGDGKIVVTGEGSTLVVTGLQAYAGIGNHGTGSLLVEAGADLTVASSALYSGLFIGDEAGSNGVATVRDSGTTVSVTGTDAVISVGDNGVGQLAIEDGALVNTFFMQVGRAGDGTVVVDGPDTKLIVSNDSGNFSGSDRIYAGFVQVGRSEGSSGELDVTGGATLEIRNGTVNPGAVEPGLQIGRNSGSDGEVNVSGPGSQIVISQDAAADGMRNIFGAFIQVGREGSGRLSIDDGGQVLVNGDQAELRVGARDDGFGVLDIENGSRLTVNGGIGEASAAIGAQGFGEAIVAGAGSVLEILGADTWFEIGQESFGQLTIAEGGTVTNVGTTLLGSNGGTGVVTINNAGSSTASTFNAGQRLIIGAVEEWGTFGSGTVVVNSLGVLAAGAAFAGDADILVGQFSVLDIGDGATVIGDVALLGGTLSAGDFATGTADLQGDLDADSGMLRFEIAGNEAGSTYDLIDVAGNASLHDLTLDFTFSIAAIAGESFEFLTAAFLDTTQADYAVAIHGLSKGLNFSVTNDVDGVSLNILTGAASGGSSEYFLGSFRDDSFFGSFSDDSLSGSNGNDFLYGSEGSDTIDGGADNDILFGVGGGDSLVGGFGNDLLDGGDDNTTLIFEVDDTISGGDGDDTVRGGTGYDSLDGGADIDTIDYSGAIFGVIVNLAPNPVFSIDPGRAVEDSHIPLQPYGIDTLIGFENVIGSNSDDTLIGSFGDNNLFGAAGTNLLIGLKGADILTGGFGFDDVDYSLDGALGGSAGVIVNLATGLATDGFGFVDQLFGIEGIIATNSADSLTGGGDADVEIFRGLKGNDTIDGGGGFDEVDYSLDLDAGGTNGVIVNLATGIGKDGWGDSDKLSNIEAVRGGGQADTLIGGTADERFRGLDGSDSINGGGGFDTVDYRRDNASGGGGSVVVNLSGSTQFGQAAGTAKDGFGNTDTLVSIENVFGTVSNDILIGGAGGSQLQGEQGADTLVGGGNGDTLFGGDDGDSLNGGGGTDTLVGGKGADTLIGGLGADVYQHSGTLADGHDIVQTGDNGVDVIVFTTADLYDLNYTREGNDLVIGAAINSDYNFGDTGSVTVKDHYLGASIAYVQIDTANYNLLYGTDKDIATFYFTTDLKNGIDNLDAAEFLQGTDGADEINANGGFYDLVDGNGGNDTIHGGDGVDNLRGTGGDDRLFGDGGDDRLRGDAGDDTLDGGTGIDEVRYNLAAGGVIVNLATGIAQDIDLTGNSGTDKLSNLENIQGSALSDSLTGDDEANRIRSLDGDDTLSGGAGNDTLIGGLGNDRFEGDADSDEYRHGLNEGFDTVVGADGLDIVAITGEGLYDLNYTREGNDLVIGAAIDENYNFDDTGSITIKDHYLGAAIAYAQIDTENYNLLYGTDEEVATFYFTTDIKNGIDNADAAEVLQGTDGDDEINGNGGFYDALYGGRGQDTIDGGAGFDNIRGGRGNDSLLGGLGDDMLRGDEGNDTLDGGDGSDTVRYNNADGGVFVDLTISGSQLVSSEQGFDTLINIENLEGSQFQDMLIGNSEANHLRGRGDSDTLVGGGGFDRLDGEGGNDILAIINTSIDRIDGGDGDDTLRIDGSGGAVDMTSLVGGNHIVSIERIDLGEGGANSLSVTAEDVLDIADNGELIVLGGLGDSVTATGGWTAAGSTSFGDHDFNVYVEEVSGARLLVDADISVVSAT